MKNTSGPVMVNFELSAENREYINALEGGTIRDKINRIISEYANMVPIENAESDPEEDVSVDVKIKNILMSGKVGFLPWYSFEDISYAEAIVKSFKKISKESWTVTEEEGFYKFSPSKL